jgi:hypothetical protein
MRSKLVALVGLLLLAGVASPVVEAAVHDAKWRATGHAVSTAGQVHLMTVSWNGGFWCGGSTFTVTLTDAFTGAVSTRTFRGTQTFYDPPTFGGQFMEWLLVDGNSLEPSVSFDFVAAQAAFLYNPPHTLTQVIVGTYQGLTFQATTINEFWSFC